MKRTFTASNTRRIIQASPSALAGGLFLLAASSYAGAPIPTVSSPPPHPAAKVDTQWDMAALKRRGILPEQLENFDKLNEIPRGMNLVDLTLNGDFIGSLQVQVNPQGIICFTPELLTALGMTAADSAQATGCYDWLGENPEASARWQSETQTLSIVVPQAWQQATQSKAESGGTAAHINYNYYSTLNTAESGSQRYGWLSLNGGINVANWLLRSDRNIQDNAGKISSSWGSTYLEHFFSPIKKIMQLGEISARNTLFALGQLHGIQLFPDGSLPGENGNSGAVIDGVANAPQARVEVRQYDRLIFSTLVPAGPFHLVNIPVENVNAALNVTVVETSGEKQTFMVPVAQLSTAALPEPQALSIAMGKLVREGDSSNVPAILTLDKSWQPYAALSLRGGALLSGRYQSVVAALTGQPQSMPGNVFSLQAMLVQSRYQHKQTGQLRFYSSHTLGNNLSLSLGASKNTPGFASLEEALSLIRRKNNPHSEINDTELSIGLSWATDWLGSLTVSHSRTTRYPDSRPWQHDILSWNRRFGNGLLVTSSLARTSGGGKKNSNINLNVSWPLGESRIRHFMRSHNHNAVLGSELAMPLSSRSDFQLGVDATPREKNRSIQASLSHDLRYSTLNLNIQADNQHHRNYGINGSGAVVLHRQGVTFSNGTVQDTWALLSLNRALAGIPIATPNGIAWTDWRGKAVIPALTPWQDNSIDIDVDRLPKNIDLINGHRTVRLARGSVKEIGIPLLTGSRVLMNIQLGDGQPLPKGSTLWYEQKIIAEAVDDGVVFIANAEPIARYRVKIAHSTNECDIHYALKDSDDPASLYQQLSLICQ